MRATEDGVAVVGAGVGARSQQITADAVPVSKAATRSGRARRATIELMVGAVTSLMLVTFLGRLDVAVVISLGAWGLLSNLRAPSVAGPMLRQVTPLFRSAGVVLALGAVATSIGAFDLASQVSAVTATLAAALVASVVRTVAVRRAGPVRTILVGDLMSVSQWNSQWRGRRGVKVVGTVVVEPDTDPGVLPRDLLGVPVTASLEELPARVEQLDADMVAIAPSPGLTDTDVRRATWLLEDSRAATAMLGLFDGVAPQRIGAGVIGGATLCELEAPRRSAFVLAIKHGLDRAAAGLGLVLVAPLLAVIAVAIRIDSRGPALFKQTRVGRHGVPFTVYKLRTMVTDAEEIKHRLAKDNEFDGVLFKMKQDPRITRLGNFLRKSSIDELPQLVNVLKGQMSLVGPRPFLPSETAEMRRDHLRRLAVRPGITGLWQVSGRSDLDWEESVALDTYYADNWTLGGDVQIALRTVTAVLGAKGAY